MVNLSIKEETKIELADKIIEKFSKSNSKEKHDEKVYKYKKINTWCIKHIQIENKKLTLKDIMCADYLKLCKIKEQFENKIEEWKKLNADDFMKETLYGSSFPRTEFFSSININVCPYCNRNFINSYKNVSTYELDHFFPKSEYPLLAVSFENLIPVCPACNRRKKKELIDYSPYNKKYDIDSLLQFSYVLKNINYLSDKSSIAISINAKNIIIQKNIDVLELEKLYQTHIDIVHECIKKGMVYSEEYISSLINTYPNVFESKEDIYQIIFNNYFKIEDYCKRPLAKMTKDIVKEVFEALYAVDIDEIFLIE